MKTNVYKDPTSGKVIARSSLTTAEALSYVRALALLAHNIEDFFLAPPEDADEAEENAEPRASIPHDIKLGHLALRDDGAILLSTEDCDDRSLEGREIISCIVLTPEEATLAHEGALDGIAFTAARIANKLPKK